MKEVVLPPLIDEPETLEDVVYTWKVESWRSLNKKEHGPIIEAGGFPWYGLNNPAPSLASCFSLNRTGAFCYSRRGTT